VGPARIVTESLTQDPELENSQGHQPQSIAILIHRMHGRLQTLIVPIGPAGESGSRTVLATTSADRQLIPDFGRSAAARK
jgi:hypothetical protein